jgi:hypothetical protein
MDGPIAGVALPTADCYVDVAWIDLDPITDTADTFCSNQSASGTQERVEHDLTASGAVEKGVGYKGYGLDSRMEGKEVALVALFG